MAPSNDFMQVLSTDGKAQWHADQQVHANAEGAAQRSGFFPPFRLQLAAHMAQAAPQPYPLVLGLKLCVGFKALLVI